MLYVSCYLRVRLGICNLSNQTYKHLLKVISFIQDYFSNFYHLCLNTPIYIYSIWEYKLKTIYNNIKKNFVIIIYREELCFYF